MRLRYAVAILALLVLHGLQGVKGQPGHSVGITVNGAPDTRIRLAYHLGPDKYIKDSLTTDGTGKGRFTGSDKLAAGVYMIVLPGNTYFEFLTGEDQHFDISCNLSDPTATLAFRGSDENTRFLEYQREWKSLQEEATALSEKLRSSPSGKDAASLKQQLGEREKKMKEYLHKTADENKGTLLGAIAASIIPVEPTVPKVPAGMANPDSIHRLWSWLAYKDHFFDNIDFGQPGLIRSPILAAKLDQFFGQVVIQMPDSLIKEADRVLEMSSRDKEVFQYTAVWLLNRYATSEIMGHDAVVVHLADEVYLSGKAPWATAEYLADLGKRIERLRPNLIGKKAAELVMNSFTGFYVSLYDVKADFTILYFWEPDCGHCKEATPLLKKFYDDNRSRGIEVFAVCTQQDREKWEKYIADHGLSWINGWDPQRLSRFDYFYNVESTPLIYILDWDKRIIAKRLSVENIGPFIDNYRKFQQQTQSPAGR